MPIDTPVADLVRQLSRVGLRPDERLVNRILSHGDAARSELLQLATSVDELHEQLPASLGPLHALRLLGELPTVELIAPLLGVIPIPIYGEEDVPARLFATEVLQIIGRVGAPAVQALWAYADDETRGDLARGAAINALAFVSAFAPEVRDAVIAEARRRLANEAQPPLVTGLVSLLAELGDAASYPVAMAAYKAGRVIKGQLSAATARQFFLSGGRKDLTCVKHSFFERYDHHGPHLRDPNEVDDDYDDELFAE